MGHGDGRRKDSAGKTVRDIRRAARRRFASLDRPLLAPVTAGIRFGAQRCKFCCGQRFQTIIASPGPANLGMRETGPGQPDAYPLGHSGRGRHFSGLIRGCADLDS